MKIKTKKINWKVLITCLIIVILIACIGSLFTTPAVKSSWYQSNKPSLTPPDIVFPIAWTILFFLIFLALYFSWTSAKTKNSKKKITAVFGFNFLLNIYWSILYFHFKNPTAAFIEIILLWISILMMILITWKINKKSAYLLIPYLLWVSFAAILNFLSAFLVY